MELTIKKIGDASGVILPPYILERLNVAEGDTVYVTETPTGLILSSPDLDLDETVAIAKRVMDEDYAVLRSLAD